MKKLLHVILSLVIVLCFSACKDSPEDLVFDESDLYGTWQEGSVYEHYYDSFIERILPNGDTVKVNGTTWDKDDDMSEDEAQLFNWTLTGSVLKHEHVGTFVVIPKLYTITELDGNKLVYKDDYGTTHHFSKVR
jgi:hypothetical protein